MKPFLLCLKIILLTCCFSAFAVETESRPEAEHITSIVVNLDNSTVKNNVLGFLKGYEGKTKTPRVLKSMRADIRRSLNALGYYHFEIQFSEDSQAVAVTIKLEAPLKWKTVNIDLIGEGKANAELLALIEDVPVRIGKQVDHSDYQATKSRLESELLELGYFDYQWQESKLIIHQGNRYAGVRLLLDTGIRYQFGGLTIERSTKAADYIRSLSPFSKGQPFEAGLLSDFNLALNETPYFSAIKVYPLLKARASGQIPVSVHVEDKPANSFELGAGYSDDVGAKTRFKWVKPWITKSGHSFESNLRISQKQQDITASYTIPVENPNDDLWRVLGGYQLQDDVTEGIDSRIWNVQVQRQWLTDDDWIRTAFIKREHESTEQKSETQKTEMLIPGVSYLKKESKGGALPYWGNKRLISIEGAADSLLSSTNMLKVRWNNEWLRSVEARHLFFGRIDLGAIVTKDIDKIPFTHRFLAGGDQSIRGFAYESVGPRDDEGRILGGKYLATGTLEYNYQFHPSWRAALFIDAGTATNDFSDAWEVGAGFGFRYLTPVGPIRLDHAWGLTKESKSTRLSIVIGPEI
ncbi:autotransporter assembly complex family protein [Pseudoalteromonas sp. PS5]|uniref:autotransporter assembly complex protein TamA n=1 Tax=Pseudoalteromonas sp. PS5 TaxID=1437473 RepID=UPI000FFE8409|nr:autotransporter assembly complex family protein [Pseudoalteromonas sp. PS5]RXE95862.1 outer membrane protein assembly factor [Pseudoalteromonas sp. PS5]